MHREAGTRSAAPTRYLKKYFLFIDHRPGNVMAGPLAAKSAILIVGSGSGRANIATMAAHTTEVRELGGPVPSPTEPEDVLSVEFELTREEYLAGSHMAMRRHWALLVLPLAGLLLLIIGSVVNFTYFGPGVVLLLCSGWVWWGAPRRRWRTDPAQAGPFTYRFDDRGITIASPAGNVHLVWERVRGVLRGRRLTVLTTVGAAVAVPNRVLSTSDQSRLDNLLGQRVQR
jgi:hypothetical protein